MMGARVIRLVRGDRFRIVVDRDAWGPAEAHFDAEGSIPATGEGVKDGFVVGGRRWASRLREGGQRV